MRSTDVEKGRTEAGEIGRLRALGALEHLFFLIDQHRPLHFAMAAEIAGAPTPAAWRKALYLVQLRHPLLSVRIERCGDGVPCFRKKYSPIPLRIVESTDQSWEAAVGEELATPFNPFVAPLVRAVLVRGDNRCEIILVAHHSIADGMSLVFVLRDLVHALHAAPIDVLPLLPSQDELLARAASQDATGAGASATPPTGPSATFRNSDGAHPTINSHSLGPELTARIRNRARWEGSTVHGALCAAVATAGRQLSPVWREIPLRFLSPVNARPLLSVGDDCGLLIGAATVVVSDLTTFWDVARNATSTARAGKSATAVKTIIDVTAGFLSTGSDPARACEFAVDAFAREAMISNLGDVPVDFRYAPFKVRALWGPMVLAGFEGDQSIGATSLAGSLHLTHASYTPFPGLLTLTEKVLADACA